MGKAQDNLEQNQRKVAAPEHQGDFQLDLGVFRSPVGIDGLSKCFSRPRRLTEQELNEYYEKFGREPVQKDMMMPLAGLGFDVKVNDSLVAMKVT